MNYELTINKLVLCISDCKLLVNEALGCESFPWGFTFDWQDPSKIIERKYLISSTYNF